MTSAPSEQSSMARRRVLRLPAVGVLVLLAASCTHSDVPSIADDGDMLLTEGGFTAPALETWVVDGPPGDESRWDPIVAFSGPADDVEAWIQENFPSGIESRAYKDDMQIAVERLGEGVQMEGDRLAHGVHDPISFVVVVGQQEEPTVHVSMWGPVR